MKFIIETDDINQKPCDNAVMEQVIPLDNVVDLSFWDSLIKDIKIRLGLEQGNVYDMTNKIFAWTINIDSISDLTMLLYQYNHISIDRVNYKGFQFKVNVKKNIDN